MQVLRESLGYKIQWDFTNHYEVSKRCTNRFSKGITISKIGQTHYAPHGGNFWLRTQKQKLCDSNNTVLSLLHVKGRTILFLRGGWANAKKFPLTAFAEEINIVHSSIKQINILQASEIKFKRRSPMVISDEKIFLQKKIAHPPPPIKNIMAHPFPFSGRWLQLTYTADQILK